MASNVQDETKLVRLGRPAMFVAALLMGLVGLQSIPPLWWDEGWTLCVARTWVETGHYGCLLSGQPAPPMLSGHFPIVASISASFSLFGVGIWQARLVGLLYTLATLGLLYLLTAKLYSRATGVVALAILLFVPVMWEIHPIILGRQVLGEMPMLCFLLAGYLSFLMMDRHRVWFLAAVGWWALALMAKSQTAPFWIVSLLAPLSLALWKRDWPLVRWLLGGLVCSWLLFGFFDQAKNAMIGHHTSASSYVRPVGLLEASAIVLVASTRINVLLFTLHYCVPALVGYLSVVGTFWRQVRSVRQGTFAEAVRLMVWILGASWLGWFMFLSVGWERYVFPALFLAAPFLAHTVEGLTLGYSWERMREAMCVGWTRRQCGGDFLHVMGAVILLLGMGLLALGALHNLRWSDRDTQVQEVAIFLNEATPASAMIETFDSELFLLLNRPFHYPPAQVNVELIRRQWHEGSPSMGYDPLMADPDYVVVGRFGRWLGVYAPLVEAGQVRLIKQIGRYDVYERVRG